MSGRAFEAEFRVLFEARFPALFRYLDRLSGDPALAADLAQETFVRLYDRGEVPDDVRAWLVSVATNLFRDERRRSDRRLRLLRRRTPDVTMGDASPSPDDHVLRTERRDAVRAALDGMPERDRELLLLRFEGYSYRELALALDLVESSVGTLLTRAKAAFRSVFERRYGASR
jgi:RNA polymerase sigma-70 factor (ECF subfamily)